MEKGGGELRVTAGEEGVKGCEDRMKEASECQGDEVVRREGGGGWVVEGGEGVWEDVRGGGEDVWRVMVCGGEMTVASKISGVK